MSSIPTRTVAEERNYRNRWKILLVVAVAQLMVVLDATIVNIALPTAQQDLGFADANRQWVVTGYALAFGSLLLFGGRLADRYGPKWMFLAGLVGFAVASAVGGGAQTFAVLVTSRVLQGVFAALLAPAALSILTASFVDPKERGKAFGVFGAVAGGGGAAGLILGGLLTEHLSWRACFYVNLVFAAAGVIGGFLLLKAQALTARQRIDVAGALLAAVGVFALVFGFSRAETDGWSRPFCWASLSAAVVLLAGFVLLEQQVAHPLLPLRIVTERNRAGAFVAMAFASVAVFAVFLFLTYYLQLVLSFTPVVTGLAFLPMMLLILGGTVAANVALVPRLGARAVVTGGLVLGAVGMAFLSRLTPSSDYLTGVLPALPLLGLGFGCVIAPSIDIATSRIAAHDAGVASGMVNTVQQIGGSVGTALLSTIAANATTRYVQDHGQSAGLAGAVHGYALAFGAAAGVFVLGAVLAFALLHGRSRAAAAAVSHEAADQLEPVTTP